MQDGLLTVQAELPENIEALLKKMKGELLDFPNCAPKTCHDINSTELCIVPIIYASEWNQGDNR